MRVRMGPLGGTVERSDGPARIYDKDAADLEWKSTYAGFVKPPKHRGEPVPVDPNPSVSITTDTSSFDAAFPFIAVCRATGCHMHDKPARYSDYLERQIAVGEHRLSTGHTVDMSEAPAPKSEGLTAAPDKRQE